MSCQDDGGHWERMCRCALGAQLVEAVLEDMLAAHMDAQRTRIAPGALPICRQGSAPAALCCLMWHGDAESLGHAPSTRSTSHPHDHCKAIAF